MTKDISQVKYGSLPDARVPDPRRTNWDEFVKSNKRNDIADPNFNDVLAKMKEVTRLAKQIAPSEPEIDYEPVQIDRRTDLDYIEKLTGDHKLLVMVLAELVSQGKADFLFIEYPQIQEIWHRHCKSLGQLRAKENEEIRIQELKESGLSKLTEEEKKALGIK